LVRFGSFSLFGWLVADGWCWFLLREEYCWLVAGGWFVLREKYCWLVADKPSEQAVYLLVCNPPFGKFLKTEVAHLLIAHKINTLVLRRIIGIICLLFRSKGLFCQIPKVLLTA
jgi:hypothetical protein